MGRGAEWLCCFNETSHPTAGAKSRPSSASSISKSAIGADCPDFVIWQKKWLGQVHFCFYQLENISLLPLFLPMLPVVTEEKDELLK